MRISAARSLGSSRDRAPQRDAQLGLDRHVHFEVGGAVASDDALEALAEVGAQALRNAFAAIAGIDDIFVPVDPRVVGQPLEERRIAHHDVAVAGAELDHRADDLVEVGAGRFDDRAGGQRQRHVHARRPGAEREGVEDEHRAMAVDRLAVAQAHHLADDLALDGPAHPARRSPARARAFVDHHAPARQLAALHPLVDRIGFDVARLVHLGDRRKVGEQAAGEMQLGQAAALVDIVAVGGHPAVGQIEASPRAPDAELPAGPLIAWHQEQFVADAGPGERPLGGVDEGDQRERRHPQRRPQGAQSVISSSGRRWLSGGSLLDPSLSRSQTMSSPPFSSPSDR